MLSARREAVAGGEKRQVRVDLGCGSAKCAGFIGADRLPLAGVDVVLDFDMPLPFRSDSVDLLVMSHSLEHVRDLLATLREAYRICRHGAQVCVVAPYAHQALNIANPFHLQSFNEHTPRFWTDARRTIVKASEFLHPHAQDWGLSRSDQGDPGIDFRCVSMEFFYFPEYLHLPPDQQRRARKKYFDVCDQIMYHFIVVKNDPDEAEMHELLEGMRLFEPPRITLRKSDERIAALEVELHLARAEATRAREDLQILRVESSAIASRLADASADLAATREAVADAHENASLTQQRLEQAREELIELRSRLENARQEERAGKLLSDNAHARLDVLSQRLDGTERRLAVWERCARAMSLEVVAMRRRRILRMYDRFRPGPDLSHEIDNLFKDLRDDSYLFIGNLKGYRLQPSEDLQTLRSLTYVLKLGRSNLSGLVLAPILDLPDDTGSLGIELATPEGLLVASVRVSLAAIAQHRPARFVFAPIPSSAGPLVLRVVVHDTSTPVRVFEWRKRRLWGLGQLVTQPFCAFIFT